MKETDIFALRELVELRDDAAALEENSTDAGHILFQKPRVVATPKSAREVLEIIQWANRTNSPVVVRGTGHTMGGQVLTRETVINLRGLNRVGEIEGNAIWVQGGVMWRDLVTHVLPHGYMPVVLTNNLDTTIGGTLATGGLGRSSHQHGLQADNVEELEVVTGNGQLVRCSATEHQTLFDCTRGGMGQFSVITQARIRLRKVLPRVRTFCLLYEDLQTLLDDQETGIFRDRFTHVRAWCRHQSHEFGFPEDAASSASEWRYPLHASVEFDAEPDQDELLEGLGHVRLFRTEDQSAMDFADMPETGPEMFKRNPFIPAVSPVTEAVVPWSAVIPCMADLLERIPRAFLPFCNLMLRPLHDGLPQISPVLMRPNSTRLMGLGIIPSIPQAIFVAALPVFGELGRLLVEHGGKRYLTGWVRYDHAQWKAHYGEHWPQVLQWKERFDPKGILNLGFIHYQP